MIRRDWSALLVCGAAAALILVLCSLARRSLSPQQGPHTVHQFARMADDLGLYHRSDMQSGRVISRLIVSDRPLTYRRANSLRLGDPDHECWNGTVAVTSEGQTLAYLCDGEHGVLWGNMLLYGDPALIRQLMACPVPAEESIDESEPAAAP